MMKYFVFQIRNLRKEIHNKSLYFFLVGQCIRFEVVVRKKGLRAKSFSMTSRLQIIYILFLQQKSANKYIG